MRSGFEDMREDFGVSWQHVSIGSVSKVVTKGTTPTSIGFNFVKEGIPFLRVNNIQNGMLIYEDILFIDSKTDKALARSRIQPRDVLISIAGTIGRTAVVPLDSPAMNCNQAVAIVRLCESVDPYYLNYWLGTDDAIKQITGSKVTATISNLSLGCIKELQIPLPSLEEQRRIAAILDRADAIRRKRIEAIRLTEELLRSTFLEMFGDPVTNPKGWEVVSLKSIVEEMKYGTNSKCHDVFEDKDFPVLRIPNISNEQICWSDLKYAQVNPPEASRLLLKEGDILFVRTNGNPEYIGRCAIFEINKTDYKQVLYASYLIRARLKTNAKISSAFIRDIISFPSYRMRLVREAKTTAGNYNISIEGLGRLRLIAPPLDLQEKYIKLTQKMTHSSVSQQNYVKDLDNFFNSLLQRAFRGEL